VQPPSRGDAVGDVGKLIRAVYLDKVLEDGGLDQIGVKLGDTINFMRTDNGEVGHTDHFWL